MSLAMILKPVISAGAKFISAHGAQICMASGAVSIGLGIFEACKATTKASAVVDEFEQAKATIKEAREIGKKYENGELGDVKDDKLIFTEKDYKKSMAQVTIGYGLAWAKLYGKAAGLIIAGFGSIFMGYHMLATKIAQLTKDLASTSAALATTTNAFEAYRNVIRKEDGGEERDKRAMDSAAKVMYPDFNHDKPGPVDFSEYDKDLPSFIRFFGPSNTKYDNINWMMNPNFLSLIESIATAKLRHDKILMLNDVYVMLGYAPTWEGYKYGWRIGDDRVLSDDYVTFRIGSTDAGKRFLEGYEDTVMLNFNCVPLMDLTQIPSYLDAA